MSCRPPLVHASVARRPRPVSSIALLAGVIGLGRLTSGSSVLGGLSGVQPGARRPHFAGTRIPCLMRFHLRLTQTLAEFIEPCLLAPGVHLFEVVCSSIKTT